MLNHRIGTPAELLIGLICVAWDQHKASRESAVPAPTLAENLRDYARAAAADFGRRATAHREAGDGREAAGLEYGASCVRSVADLLDCLIPAWNRGNVPLSIVWECGEEVTVKNPLQGLVQILERFPNVVFGAWSETSPTMLELPAYEPAVEGQSGERLVAVIRLAA